MVEQCNKEDANDISEQLENATPILCDFIVGNITEANSGDVFVTLIPEKDGDIGHIFFIIPVDLALSVSEAMTKIAHDILAKGTKQ